MQNTQKTPKQLPLIEPTSNYAQEAEPDMISKIIGSLLTLPIMFCKTLIGANCIRWLPDEHLLL